MSLFLENARSIFETATGAARGGWAPSELTVLIGPEGIRMLADCDWPLERLAAHHGAEMAYRVTERGGEVRLEGRAAGRSCSLRERTPAGAARELLGLRFSPAPPRAGILPLLRAASD